jgi:hypothetical protein
LNFLGARRDVIWFATPRNCDAAVVQFSVNNRMAEPLHDLFVRSTQDVAGLQLPMPVVKGDLRKFLADPATTQEDINRLTLTTLDFLVRLTSKQIVTVVRDIKQHIREQIDESTNLQQFPILGLTAAEAMAQFKTVLGGAVEFLQWIDDKVLESHKNWSSISKGTSVVTN